MHSIEELERVMMDGFADVECSASCGEGGRVEPDGDYPCECGEGRLTSPLILEGLI